MRIMLKNKFVEFIPDTLEQGVIYVALQFGTVAHKCCCGCGNEVFTPLSPTDWKLTYDGDSISLHPSIGNWSFPCQSHYWITKNKVKWSGQWSTEQIQTGRKLDSLRKVNHYREKGNSATKKAVVLEANSDPSHSTIKPRLLHRLLNWARNLFS